MLGQGGTNEFMETRALFKPARLLWQEQPGYTQPCEVLTVAQKR